MRENSITFIRTLKTKEEEKMKPLLKPPPLIKFPTRVEWENEAVDVFVDDDDEALLMTAQDGVIIQLFSLNHKSLNDGMVFNLLQGS